MVTVSRDEMLNFPLDVSTCFKPAASQPTDRPTNQPTNQPPQSHHVKVYILRSQANQS